MTDTSRYNHIEYMESVAKSLVDILHTTGKPRFFKSTGLMNLEGLVASITAAKLPALIVEDTCDEQLIDNLSDNLIERPFYSFFIIYGAKTSDADSIFTARSKAKTTAKKVLSLMFKHMEEYSYGLRNLNLSSIRFLGVGPIADFGYGVQVSFTLDENSDIAYNEEDWNE